LNSRIAFKHCYTLHPATELSTVISRCQHSKLRQLVPYRNAAPPSLPCCFLETDNTRTNAHEYVCVTTDSGASRYSFTIARIVLNSRHLCGHDISIMEEQTLKTSES
jgi:hypothetical protein